MIQTPGCYFARNTIFEAFAASSIHVKDIFQMLRTYVYLSDASIGLPVPADEEFPSSREVPPRSSWEDRPSGHAHQWAGKHRIHTWRSLTLENHKQKEGIIHVCYKEDRWESASNSWLFSCGIFPIGSDGFDLENYTMMNFWQCLATRTCLISASPESLFMSYATKTQIEHIYVVYHSNAKQSSRSKQAILHWNS